MKVVVGLGNPGSRYEGTRHNIGFDVVFELSRRWQAERPRQKFEAEVAEAVFGSEKVLLVWPQTFMNLSGRTVGEIFRFRRVELNDILVISDDMNLRLGQLRLRGSGSAGGQKGLLSIIQVLGTEAFARLRVGVDRPPAGQDAANYVLARFRKEELDTVDAAVRQAALGVESWISRGLEAAMNLVNTAADPGTAAGSQ